MSDTLSEEVLGDEKLASTLLALGNPLLRGVLLELYDGRVMNTRNLMLRSSQNEEIQRELESEHLPMMEEAGFIEWDPEAGEIRKGPNFEEIKPVLQLIQNHPDELPPGWP